MEGEQRYVGPLCATAGPKASERRRYFCQRLTKALNEEALVEPREPQAASPENAPRLSVVQSPPDPLTEPTSTGDAIPRSAEHVADPMCPGSSEVEQSSVAL